MEACRCVRFYQKRTLKTPLRMCHNRAVLRDAELALDGSLHELARLAEELERFCRERSLGSEIQFDLNLALEELFTNAVQHGGCEGMERAVKIRLEAAG